MVKGIGQAVQTLVSVGPYKFHIAAAGQRARNRERAATGKTSPAKSTSRGAWRCRERRAFDCARSERTAGAEYQTLILCREMNSPKAAGSRPTCSPMSTTVAAVRHAAN